MDKDASSSVLQCVHLRQYDFRRSFVLRLLAYKRLLLVVQRNDVMQTGKVPSFYTHTETRCFTMVKELVEHRVKPAAESVLRVIDEISIASR